MSTKLFVFFLISSLIYFPVAIAGEIPFYLKDKSPLPSPISPIQIGKFKPGRVPYADWIVKRIARVTKELNNCYSELEKIKDLKDSAEKKWILRKIEKKTEYFKFLSERFQKNIGSSLTEEGYAFSITPPQSIVSIIDSEIKTERKENKSGDLVEVPAQTRFPTSIPSSTQHEVLIKASPSPIVQPSVSPEPTTSPSPSVSSVPSSKAEEESKKGKNEVYLATDGESGEVNSSEVIIPETAPLPKEELITNTVEIDNKVVQVLKTEDATLKSSIPDIKVSPSPVALASPIPSSSEVPSVSVQVNRPIDKKAKVEDELKKLEDLIKEKTEKNKEKQIKDALLEKIKPEEKKEEEPPKKEPESKIEKMTEEGEILESNGPTF